MDSRCGLENACIGANGISQLLAREWRVAWGTKRRVR